MRQEEWPEAVEMARSLVPGPSKLRRSLQCLPKARDLLKVTHLFRQSWCSTGLAFCARETLHRDESSWTTGSSCSTKIVSCHVGVAGDSSHQKGLVHQEVLRDLARVSTAGPGIEVGSLCSPSPDVTQRGTVAGPTYYLLGRRIFLSLPCQSGTGRGWQ